MPSKKHSNTGRVLSKKAAFLFVVVAAICSLCIQNSAARQSPSRRVTAGSPISPRVMRQPAAAAARQLPTPREDFDLRIGHQRSLAAPPETATAAAAPQSVQVSQLKRARPGVRIKWSSLTGTPSRISSHTEALSDPIAADPRSAARNFLKGNEDLFRLTAAEVDSLREARRYLTGHNGVTHLTLQQQVGGIDLFQSAYTINVDREGAVIAASGELIPGAARAGNMAQPKITALESLRSAVGQAGAEIKEAPQQRLSASSADARQEFAAGQSFGRDVRARLVYFPLSADQARLAWEFVIWMRETPDVYLILIDAERNNLLYRHNLTDYEKNPLQPHGLVYTGDSPRPDSPHNSDAPPVVERQDMPFHSAPFNGSALFRRDDSHYDWWNGKPATGLVSNNTDVHLDRDSLSDQPDLPRLTSPIGNFSFPVDLEAEPLAAANQKAAQVNLFYWVNRYHDILYSFGFNEAAGNFQTDNFGLGGLGGDPVMGDVQDGSGINNANFATPPDGQPGRVQMYLWNLTSPQLDGSFDQQVILHELTHGLSNRLIGDGDGLNPFQSGGLGEGWSDFFALALLSEENDDPDATYPVGGYAFNDYAGGIRRYPYSTDMRVDPLTFGSLGPFFVHDAGEIWCTMLWEMRALLIKQHGFREGQRQSLQLVVDGMKLTPSSPTFIDARDAILLADRVNNRGANQCLLWQAFAKRGLGIYADTLDPEAYEAVESFEIAPSCNPTAALRLDKRSYVDNETVRITLGDSNARTPVTVTVTSSRTGDQERIRLEPEPSLPGSYTGAIRLENGSARIEDGRLQGADEAGDQIDVAYLDGRTDEGGSQRITASASWTRELVILDDDVERGNQFWLHEGTWAITSELFGSPIHSWRVANTGDPLHIDRLFMTSPPLDLTGLTEVTLSFSQNRQLRGGVSYGVVEISLDDGANWLEAKALTDRDDGFVTERLSLPGLEGQANARLRFELIDFYNGGLGAFSWAIDDIRLSGRSADPQIVPPGDPATPIITAIDPAFGPPAGGTPVTISGSNFTETADTIVTFDGIPAQQVTVLGSSAITAIAPAHRAGAVIVRVKNHRGTATLARGFTYYEPGANGGNGRTPVLGSISPASGSIRGGAVVTLTGANFTPETTVSFGTKEGLVTFINGNVLRVVTPGAAANGSVDVTARNGDRQSTLTGAFNYVAPTPPAVQLLNPQGGERFYAGGKMTIRWQSTDNREVVKHRIRFAYRFSAFPEFEVFSDIATDVSGSARSFTWTVPADMQPNPLSRIHVTASDDEGAETDAVSGDFSIAQRWEAKALLPLLAQGQYTADGSNFYVIGQTRFGTPPEFTVQRYDPVADTWTSEGLTPPPVSFFEGEAVAVSGKLYIPGGIDSNIMASRRHQAYDTAANTWVNLTDTPVYAFLHSLAADEQRGVYYHIGGLASQDGRFFNPSAKVRMYDPNTGAWTDLPPMNHDHYYHRSAIIEGKLYVAGGYSDTGDPLIGEVYDFETGRWSPIAPLHTIRYRAANTVVKDAAGNPYWLFIGDSATQVALDAEAYDVRNNRWIRLDDSFTMPPVLSPIDRLPVGRTLMGGGIIGSFLHVITNPLFGEFRNERLAIDPLDLATGGTAPVLTAPKEQVGIANTEIKFNVSASDLESFDPPAITAEGLPPGASFSATAQNSDRTVGAFTWTPTAADTGRSFDILFTASDGELSDTKQVTVRVVEASTLTLANAGDGRQIAIESIVTVAGHNLAAESKTAPATRLPIDLAGTRVTINGIAAPIFSVSADRVSFLIPVNIEPGAATIVVRNSSGHYSIGAAQIVKAAPAIFETREGSEGNAVSLSGGTSLQFPRLKTPGNNKPNILTIYGTGIRRLPGAAESVKVTIDGQPARVLYAGPQGMVRGLDQVIVEIPAGVRGSGQPRAEVAISINGVTVSRVMGLIR